MQQLQELDTPGLDGANTTRSQAAPPSAHMQVLRTLAPPLTGDLCGALLRCILQCLDPASQVCARKAMARPPLPCDQRATLQLNSTALDSL